MAEWTWPAEAWARIENLARTEREMRAIMQRSGPDAATWHTARREGNRMAAELRAIAFMAGASWRSPGGRRRRSPIRRS